MKNFNIDKIYKNINIYYTNKIKEYGPTPKGVDWNSKESQFIRFAQLSKIININEKFSINDIGCGYGKLCEYLSQNYSNFTYKGYDLSKEMIKNAKKLYPDFKFKNIKKVDDIETSDYSVASGIFNVKMQHCESEWLSYILTTLDKINNKSIKGFSFNILTKYSDKEFMRDDLYYADPLFIFDYCKRNYSKAVALLHDYGLYEFTILVRKDVI